MDQQFGSSKGFRQQAISWNNVDQFPWHHILSPEANRNGIVVIHNHRGRVESLAPGRCGSNIIIFFEHTIWIKFMTTIVKLLLGESSRSQNITHEKSALVKVMAWCHQATSHYLVQCWLRSMSLYDVTWPQWVNRSLGTAPFIHWDIMNIYDLHHRADSRFAPSQWATSLQSTHVTLSLIGWVPT